ncbi:MAG: ABC transporter permease [Spirochaetales bacterium]|nr:ABC transporter permease [Spirochaetales bacterium]
MKERYGVWYTLPLFVWTSIFFIVPIAIVLIYSILTKGLYGGVVWKFSLHAFRTLMSLSFLKVTMTTFVIAIISTLITILIALPVSYFLARTQNNTTLVLLVVIPFWVNFLIRVYAWIAILGREGFLNDMLLKLGIITEPIQFLFNFWSVVIVHVYTYLPYMILPLFSTIEKFDFGLLEAAQDLGASQRGAIMRIMLPNIRGGIITAVLFTFIPTLGSFAIPDLVGGPETYMLGNVIAYNLRTANNWPLASAISLVLTILTSLGLLVYFLFNRAPSKVALQESEA